MLVLLVLSLLWLPNLCNAAVILRKREESLDSLPGTQYDGTGTYYDTGVGSCGKKDTNDELIVAINKAQMGNGPNPNANPHCGKYVVVQGTNGNVKAKIEDTCPTCGSGSLDLSPAVFRAVCGDESKGKCAIHWKFT
ncbi:hypothetical protein RO3G_09000 [Lichtheimia corymbifera JMRC:FSU:9682]|uniref:RlpA-like protein double-psi beta-barrel domain-containing protein n=1 Tax=Lichtheimia corymbifera JMRC:FSU:9682 TaxID=1263082 RepID=A0A068SDJ2_9FUNG|nr:hypothetical protein RO3G_09000 [Lichtheimia corymbifera JMRC:FSU:9682]